jgi:hypothetical protein
MTDAMNEVAWCYLEGFGCKKDKVSDYESFTRPKGRALRIASWPLSHQPRRTQFGLRMRLAFPMPCRILGSNGAFTLLA